MAKRVNVYGLGYVGLPAAALLAANGYEVLGIDVQQKIIDTINAGKINIIEPNLATLVHSVTTSGRLKASLSAESADVHILAVPTPFKENHAPDLQYVEAATKTLCSVLKDHNLVILESTSPVGTTEQISRLIKQHRSDLTTIYIAHAPERARPGKTLEEMIHHDRIVGGINAESTQKAKMFYETFVHGKVLPTNARTAELCKLVENSYMNVNIAYANEVSMICDALEINAWELIHLANHHPRVNILQPGPGVGGHCIAVDPWFIHHTTPQYAQLIKHALEINNYKTHWVIQKVLAAATRFTNPVIACLGATFKEDIDDLRESPALAIIHEITQLRIGSVLTVEPNVQSAKLSTHNLVPLEQALQSADIILLLVKHQQFKNIDPELLQGKYVIDTKGIFTNVTATYTTTSH